MKFSEACITCDLLLEQGQFDRVFWLLGLVLPSVQSDAEWQQLLERIERVPEAHWLEGLEAAFVCVRVLKRNRRLDEALAFGARVLARFGAVRAASVQLECAGALIELQRYTQAQQVLEAAMPHLQGEDLGMACSRLGLTQFHLGLPWQESFARARELLSGHPLARVLTDQGYCLAQSGQGAEARNVWLEALPLFGTDSRMLAWVRYNLGISALRDLDPEAERHFLEADRLTHRPQAMGLRSASLNGLGATRRMLGEWGRAAYMYRAALEVAGDAHDRRESYFGLSRTLRLAGRCGEALEVLEFAFMEPSLERHSLHLAHAMVFLQLEEPQRAKAALERVGTLVSESDRWLERIARGELARQEGQEDLAVSMLAGLPIASLHAREEAGVFASLFGLLKRAGRPVPVPLEYVKGMSVQVRALGVLQVSVNARPVSIAPTGRIGELLVFLLEQGGAASLESIGEALYAGVAGRLDPKRVRQSVWKLVNGLRGALGWQESVLALRGAYQLDPHITWLYDVRQAREQGQLEREFLKGIYSDWALEVGRQLEALRSDQRSHQELN